MLRKYMGFSGFQWGVEKKNNLCIGVITPCLSGGAPPGVFCGFGIGFFLSSNPFLRIGFQVYIIPFQSDHTWILRDISIDTGN